MKKKLRERREKWEGIRRMWKQKEKEEDGETCARNDGGRREGGRKK